MLKSEMSFAVCETFYEPLHPFFKVKNLDGIYTHQYVSVVSDPILKSMKSTLMILHESDPRKNKKIEKNYDEQVITPFLVSAKKKSTESSDVSALLSREPNKCAEDGVI